MFKKSHKQSSREGEVPAMLEKIRGRRQACMGSTGMYRH